MVAAALAAAAAHANSPAFLFYPAAAAAAAAAASHPFSISALFAADRFNNKSTSIADLRMKAQKHAAALGLP